ncbi:MAG: protein phosphatase 2C domain-containing protein [Spirosomataceae bacterium]
MAIFIHPPLGFTFQGQRDNNEDSIFPVAGQATIHNRFFIVCDGVGGAQKGELASRVAVESFSNYFVSHPASQFSEEDLVAALQATQTQFDALLEAQHLLRGMATTFTFVGFHHQGATVAHIGDSRIYQLRNGYIIFRSEDHSKVNYLLKSGVITPEQARNHPERNVIMRAIQGSHRETALEINHLSDVQAGDYFFMCTDGVLENVTDEALGQILVSEKNNVTKLQLLLNLCEGNTRDNYSGYLLQIADTNKTTDEEWVTSVQVVDSDRAESTNPIFKPGMSATFTDPSPVQTTSAEKGQGLWYLGIALLMLINFVGK